MGYTILAATSDAALIRAGAAEGLQSLRAHTGTESPPPPTSPRK
jgi:hypothetical protein